MRLIKFVKNLEKQKLIICILTLLLVIASIVCIFMNNKANYWKEKVAYENNQKWHALSTIASLYKNDGDKESAIRARYSHVNGVLFWGVDGISPGFSGTDFYSEYFLTTGYDPFTRDIYNGKFEGTKKEQALQLFAEMNTELLEICNYVSSNFETAKKQTELLDSKSDSYKLVEKKIQDFCNTYYKKIQDLYKEN